MGGANGTDDTGTAVPLSNVVQQRLHLPYHIWPDFTDLLVCPFQINALFFCQLSVTWALSSQRATRNAIQLMAQQAYTAERLHIATGIDMSKLNRQRCLNVAEEVYPRLLSSSSSNLGWKDKLIVDDYFLALTYLCRPTCMFVRSLCMLILRYGLYVNSIRVRCFVQWWLRRVLNYTQAC